MILGNFIYRRDAKNSIRSWRYEVEGDKWRTRSGLVDSETLVLSGWTTCIPKSQPTAEEQALFEAKAEMGKKLDRDYRPSIELIDTSRIAGSKPMLAHKYEAFAAGCFSQPKLDGMRCIANKDGLWTRQGKAIVAVPHISAALAPWFAAFPDLEVDGELYNHDLKDNFNELMSICRKVKVTDEDLAKAEASVQYHIYDIASATSCFGSRFAELRQLFDLKEGDAWPVGTLSLVPTISVDDAAHLDLLYSWYLEAGYEGQMVRADAQYQNKRSKYLLKRKEFLDGEFEIVRIEQGNGNWAGYGKRLVFKLPDGRECGAGVKGNQLFTKSLLDNADQLIGKQVTVRYFTPTPDGMPRFPVAVDFHLDGAGRLD